MKRTKMKRERMALMRIMVFRNRLYLDVTDLFQFSKKVGIKQALNDYEKTFKDLGEYDKK